MSQNIPPIFAGNRDWLILLVLLLLSLVAWVAHQNTVRNKFDGACRIKIFTDPPQELTFSGAQMQPVKVQGMIGPAVIEWAKDGRVRIASSACPCKTCVNMGWTNSFSLICVPNGIVVEPVVSGQQKVDAVTR